MNHNARWFIILAVLSFVLLIIIFWKKRDSKLLALYFFIGSAAACLENVIFVWFPSYEYYPHMLKNPYYDMTLGAYLSQQFYVTSVALFIAAFNLGYGWIVALAAMFACIEIIFLKLGIYKLIWWNPVYTFAGILLYFWIAKKWYGMLLHATSPLIRFITLSGINYIVYAHLIMYALLSDHFHYPVYWYDSPERTALSVIIIYFYIRGLLTALVCFYKFRWTLQALVPVLMGGSYLLSMALHIFTFTYIWDIYLLIAADIVLLFCCNYFNRILTKH
ncbi:hypothetical protein LJR153_005261 [Paenibacillus sp. LjRoot153]|uniref:hypothetical protein n=1 Tax=Paenibacillus sp. LjRoot153 TaxID=3342270 RepID=UPI003ECE158C